MSNTLLGLDIGSSSVKAALLDIDTGKVICHATSPDAELPITAPQTGWAEQHPDLWWEHTRRAIIRLKESAPESLRAVKALGIAYQMHGLVLIDENKEAVRPSIIWCDGRAAVYGARAFHSLGEDVCLRHLGNSPGNFTASKLAWIKEHEPSSIQQATFFMLPGDFIALKLTGKIGTTHSALSEAVLWDFQTQGLAHAVLNHFNIDAALVPPISDNIGYFDVIAGNIANELGLPEGTPVTYRAGDQPNNALALGVLNPGDIAANAGTSGVVYAVNDRLCVDKESRVNNFAHLNSSASAPRIGTLMCINGAGSFYRWIRNTFAPAASYRELNALAERSSVGAKGITAIPFGNGSERLFGNSVVGASLEQLDLNRHDLSDVIRATQEGIVFALSFGLEIMKEMGLSPTLVRAGNTNMFQSALFRRTFTTATGIPLELFNTDGAEGAARGAGIGAGFFSYSDAFTGLQREHTVEPDTEATAKTREAYERWKTAVQQKLLMSENYATNR